VFLFVESAIMLSDYMPSAAASFVGWPTMKNLMVAAAWCLRLLSELLIP
jgi:hypothetical protein